MNFVPLGNSVIVELDDKKSEDNGILIPEKHREDTQFGKVFAVGSGKKNKDGRFVPVELVPGQRVLLPKLAKSEIDIAGKKFVIVSDDEILGVIEES